MVDAVEMRCTSAGSCRCSVEFCFAYIVFYFLFSFGELHPRPSRPEAEKRSACATAAAGSKEPDFTLISNKLDYY
jgi:hypothetical protein